MVNIVILLVLAIGVYSGARRGLILQAVHMAGYVVTLLIASTFYSSLSKTLEMIVPYPSDTTASAFSLYNLLKNVQFDKTFYNALAYVVILFIGWVITRIVAATLNKLSRIIVIKQLNTLGGAILGFVCNWIGLYFLFTLLSVVPIQSIQDVFSGTSFATFIVQHTPIISDIIMKTWLAYV
ncbi:MULTISPECIES: CvpA family protein [unclassified Granulicatella]|uniref:CvpA family protein n=1 Tax=unclassified Granulicatella TaxID=2630493 RepID=UPI0013D87E9F|nr:MULTISPECIES: CvpA family protein [unclassified Granulicatella]MBS4749925.1 CvpA family protein [Carnobacteriaceae bacterium zg-ZUI78]QMI86118.1 CvpA family protein [Carnobacteriaceae bacterium zg-84]